MAWVLYTCTPECGNYVASPTILAATEKNVTKNVRIEGRVMCSNPVHGAAAGRIEMRRTEVVEA